MRIHGHVVAALLEEMEGVRESACFETCETEYRSSRCIRQGSVEASVLREEVARYVLWNVERVWKAKGRVISCSEEKEMTNSDSVACMVWADNHWIPSDDREKLTCMGERYQ